MRGGANLTAKIADIAGITPACAGRSVRADGNAAFIGDHPRVCGEELTEALLLFCT